LKLVVDVCYGSNNNIAMLNTNERRGEYMFGLLTFDTWWDWWKKWFS